MSERKILTRSEVARQRRIYRTLLAEIRSAGFPVLRVRVALTPLRKLWLASKTWLFP